MLYRSFITLRYISSKLPETFEEYGCIQSHTHTPSQETEKMAGSKSDFCIQPTQKKLFYENLSLMHLSRSTSRTTLLNRVSVFFVPLTYDFQNYISLWVWKPSPFKSLHIFWFYLFEYSLFLVKWFLILSFQKVISFCDLFVILLLLIMLTLLL